MYLAGFNIMHLKAKSEDKPTQRDAIREVIRRNLVGTEIIADSSEKYNCPGFTYPEPVCKHRSKENVSYCNCDG